MAGIYIHIPFCAQACTYCDFHFSINTKKMDDFIAALVKEIELRKKEVSHLQFNTLYFGGGTPSILSPSQIRAVLSALKEHLKLDIKEFTFEANPEHLNLNYIQALHRLGINRISLGVQSFNPKELKEMNRKHQPSEVMDLIKNLNKSGIHNISVDLIFGWPGSTVDSLKESLDLISELPVQHLSAYSLGVENKTLLEKQIKEGTKVELQEEAYLEQYLFLQDYLKKHTDFIPYELSNYAKKGYQSQHNSSYWELKEYIGFGPSAHSYLKGMRSFNIPKNGVYIKQLGMNQLPKEEDPTNTVQKLNEYLMIRLRTHKGLVWADVAKHFGSLHLKNLKDASQKLSLETADMIVDEYGVRLKDKALYLSDHIILELFQE